MCKIKLYRDFEKECNHNLKRKYYKRLKLEKMKELLKEKLIEGHKRYSLETKFDKSYIDYKEKFKIFKDINNLSVDDVRKIAIGFANSWHSRIDKNSAKDILNHLRNIQNLLLNLNGNYLFNLNLDDNEEEITKIYSGFPKKVKPTGRSKILHMLNGNVFPMWDEGMRIRYGVYPNAQGYFNYMNLIQKQLKTLSKEDIKEIEKLTRRPIIKIIDETNWFEVNKLKEVYQN